MAPRNLPWSPLLLLFLASGLLAAPEELIFERITPRGEAVPGVLHLPEGSQRLPAVVFAPGQGYHKDLPIVRRFAEEAVWKDVATFRFDWAYTAEEGAPSRDLAEEAEDLATVLDFARSHPRVDPERVFLAGKSLGTLVAYRAFREREGLRGLLLFTPVCTSRWTEDGQPREEPQESGEENYPGLLEERRPVWIGLGIRDPLCEVPMLHDFLDDSEGEVSVHVLGGDHGLNLGPWDDPAFRGVNARNVGASVGSGLHWLELQLDSLAREAAAVRASVTREGTPGSRAEVDRLGAVVVGEETVFSLWSPDSDQVELLLGDVVHPMKRVPDFAGYQDVYQVRVPGNQHGLGYRFRVGGVEVRDPYGTMAAPQEKQADGSWGGGWNVVLDPTRTELEGPRPPVPPLREREDAVIYEVHVRDFTMAENSGVPEDERGTFAGMVRRGTRHEGMATGLDHLVELGVTHVQLLPVYDFGSCPDVEDRDCYNWGYDPRNFNVPEERYSRTPRDWENRVREFKQMVDGFHRAGLRVVMDVVYNHTYAREMFEGITPRYYTPTDLSGCGNSVDATEPMVSRMIQDSLEYWVREYGVDGFRFDLVGIFDFQQVGAWARHLNATFPGRNLLLYGEPWNGYASDPREAHRVRLGTVGWIHDAHFGVFNPKFRDAIKGRNDAGGAEPGDGFVFGPAADTLRIAIGGRGAVRPVLFPSRPVGTWDPAFAMDPEQAIQYVSAHDNLTLRDKILAWARQQGVPENDPRLRRMQKFANGIILTSQGIPFLHGGVELMRDKQGDHNSYRSPDSVNRFDWDWKRRNADVLAYYRDVLALRREHPGLRLNSWREIHDHVVTTRPREGVVVHHIDARAQGDRWSEMLILWNAGEDYEHPLPEGVWKVALEESDPGRGNGREVRGVVRAAGTAVTLLYRE